MSGLDSIAFSSYNNLDLFDMFHIFTKASPENFYPGVSLEFSDRLSPVERTWKNSELSLFDRFWDMKKYVGNMKKYAGNMKKVDLMIRVVYKFFTPT